MTTLSGKLPKGDRNGIGEHVAAFVKDPTRTHVVIAVVDTAKVVTNIDTGDVEPSLRILRVERVLPRDAEAAEKLLRRSLEHRTGATTLNLGLEDEITVIFREASIDDKTGELHYPTKPEEDQS